VARGHLTVSCNQTFDLCLFVLKCKSATKESTGDHPAGRESYSCNMCHTRDRVWAAANDPCYCSDVPLPCTPIRRLQSSGKNLREKRTPQNTETLGPPANRLEPKLTLRITNWNSMKVCTIAIRCSSLWTTDRNRGGSPLMVRIVRKGPIRSDGST
jgi:hypothetical protein